MASPRYEITVWSTHNRIVRKCWNADQAEHDEVMEQYGNELFYDVVVDDEWEQDDD